MNSYARQKYAGDERWEEGLVLSASVVMSAGGPRPFMAARETPQRRFLIEQLVCMELLGESQSSSTVRSCADRDWRRC